MKRIYILILLLVLSFTFCKKKDKFVEPDFIFSKWVRATEQLNYSEYKKCEAFPKSEQVFRELYRDRYYVDLMVTGVEDLDEEKVEKDHQKQSFVKRNVTFECTEVVRKTRKPVRLLRGDVDFIKYIDGKRARDGWLMWNRKIIRINR